jgi:hypothetical protein
VTLVLRRLGWTRNPLCRTTDRLEGLLIVGTILAAVLAVPLAVGSAQQTYDEGVRASAVAAAHGQWARATLVADAPVSVSGGSDAPSATAETPATWRAPDGTAHRGPVPAPAGAEAGSTVRVWLDDSGRVSQPPPRADQLSDRAVATGLTTWMALELGVVVSYLLLRWLLDRRRLAGWDAEWQRVAPRWTRKLR